MSGCPELKIANATDWKSMPLIEVIARKKEIRNIFPSLKYNVTGLDCFKIYTAKMILERVDDYRYKFIDDQWLPYGFSEIPRPPPQVITHKDGVKLGADWMTESIDFSYIGILTGIPVDPLKTLVISCMHVYQPKVVLVGEDKEWTLVDPIQKFVVVTRMSEQLRMLKENIRGPRGKLALKRKSAEEMEESITDPS